MKKMRPLAVFRRYKEALMSLDKKDFPLKRILPAGLVVLDLIGSNKRRITSRGLTNRLSELYGTQDLMFYLHIHQANKIVHALVGIAIAVFFAVITGSRKPIFAVFALGLVMMLYFLPDYELNRKILERRRQIQMEFPDFINKITLLISAGMTVPRAWEKVARDHKKSSPLYLELNRSVIEIEAGKSLFRAYEDFARRCRTPEINKFVTVILQNMRKGNDELITVLSVQAAESWEIRKHAARRLGEEASTKLLFPLILMFIAILIIVATPAVLAMKGL